MIDSSLNPYKAIFSCKNSSTKTTTCLVLGFIGVLEGGLQKQFLESNQGTIIEHFRVWFCVTALQLSSCKGLVCSYEQFSVAVDFNCSNTTKMGFCKCRHLLTVKSIFLIFFMYLNWFGKHLNLKYERKLKFLKIFHKISKF